MPQITTESDFYNFITLFNKTNIKNIVLLVVESGAIRPCGMYCIPKLCLILCTTIPLIKPIGIEIDGLLNLGENWSYEYRILKTDSKDPSYLRMKEVADPDDKYKEIVRQRDQETARQRDEEVVRQRDEEVVRQRDEEVVRQRDEEVVRQRDEQGTRQRDEEVARHKDKVAERIRSEMKRLHLTEEKYWGSDDRLRKEALDSNVHGKHHQRQRLDKGEKPVVHYIPNTNKPETVETTVASASKNSETSIRQNIHGNIKLITVKPVNHNIHRTRKPKTVQITEADDSNDSESQVSQKIHRTRKPKSVKTTKVSHSKYTKKPISYNTQTTKKPGRVKATVASETSDSGESSENSKKITMMIYDDTTKKPKRNLRYLKDSYTEYSDSRYASQWRDSQEASASFKDKTRHEVNDRHSDDARTSIKDSINVHNNSIARSPTKEIYQALEKFINKTTDYGKNETGLKDFIKSLPAAVTTIRTPDIFTDIHKIKDDAKILDFTNHMYKQTLKIFDTVKEKTNQDHVKSQLEGLAKSYQEKFKEFLRDTSEHKIRTRLGTQRVILNTIDTSNRILRRLMNFMISDLDQKGVLRHNSGIAILFQKAIDTEQKLQATSACKKFGICRTGLGFSGFLADILTMLLKCDDQKLKQALDAFTEVVKYTNFDDVFDRETVKKINIVVDKMEREHIMMLRVIVTILTNTISSRNKPIIVNNYKARSKVVNSTLALLEIIDLLDTAIPRNETNVSIWVNIRRSLKEFAADKRNDIQDIMMAIVDHVMKCLRGLDEYQQKIVSKNLDMILSLIVE